MMMMTMRVITMTMTMMKTMIPQQDKTHDPGGGSDMKGVGDALNTKRIPLKDTNLGVA